VIRSIVIALALIANISAVEQPVLLPMPELLKALDHRQEWLMLPLAEYQNLLAAGQRPPNTNDHAPQGAWIEVARVTARLVDDHLMRLSADMEVVAAITGTSRCRLFTRLPDTLGELMVDGAPGLRLSHPDGGCDLLLPGPGRHRASVSWTMTLSEANDGARVGSIPLPLAAGIAATFTTERDGDLLGDGLVSVGNRTWTMTRAHGNDVKIAWHSGRHSGEADTAWGFDQTVQIAIADNAHAPRAWRWMARPTVLRGSLPNRLSLRLPTGWIATSTGAGVVDVSPMVDGSVTLRIDPSATTFVMDGIAPAEAAMALPAITNALWQGGRIVLTNAARLDWILPEHWQRLVTEVEAHSWRAFAVPGPDAGMMVTIAKPAAGMAVTAQSTIALGPERWRMDALLTISAGGDDHFTVPIRLPQGWRPTAVSCSVPARVAGVDADGAITDAPADGILHIDLPKGLNTSGSATNSLVLEHDANGNAGAFVPAYVIGAQRYNHRLVVASAPSLEVGIEARGWQRDVAVAVGTSASDKTIRAVLATVGDAPPIQLAVSAKRAVSEAEAVAWLLPLDGQGEVAVWCRLDLRLTVSDGEVDSLVLKLPFVPGTEQLTEPGLALVRDGERTVLTANRSWRGERLVRIEGRLANADPTHIAFPQVTIAREDGAAVPLVQHVALQAPERMDLRLEPGPAAQSEDEDDLPRWSRAIPGDPMAGVWRIGPGEAGGFSLVSRALVDPPTGFIHHLDARTQLAAAHARTLVRFRLAAPGMTRLPLRLPPGLTLVAATLDGHAVALHRLGDDVVLPLPGRTHMDIALMLEGTLAPGHVDISLPGLGGLPITDLTWAVAGDVEWRMTPGDSPEVIPLSLATRGVSRPWFGTWSHSNSSIDAASVPTITMTPITDTDPRRLQAALPNAPVLVEPHLALIGQLWHGTRLGGQARLQVTYQPLDELRRNDRLGAALAVLFGAWLAWRLRPMAAWACAAASVSLAVALHTSGFSLGPLLACSEWLAPILVLLVMIRAIARRMKPTSLAQEARS